MKRRLLLIGGLLLAGAALPARAQSILYWSASRPLTWEDFRGSKPAQARRSFDATTYSRLQYDSEQDSSGRTHVTISCSFYTNRSWKKRKRLGVALLNHEQTHFNITELYARKARRAIDACQAAHPNKPVPEWKLVNLYQRRRRALRRCQHRFDRQTRHSRRKAAERRWEMQIAAALNDLSAYAQAPQPPID